MEETKTPFPPAAHGRNDANASGTAPGSGPNIPDAPGAASGYEPNASGAQAAYGANGGIASDAQAAPGTPADYGAGAPGSRPVYGMHETDAAYHVHSSYLWLRPLISTVGFCAVVAISGGQGLATLLRDMGARGFTGASLVGLGAAILLFLVVFGVVELYHVLSYKRLWYSFGAGEFNLYSGIITKRHVHVPYMRVQSVNHRAQLLQRIFGVCTVKIETAGGAANKSVTIPYVSLSAAEDLRFELFARKAAIEQGAALVARPRSERAGGAANLAGAPVHPDALRARTQTAAGEGSVPTNAFDATTVDLQSWRGLFADEHTLLERVSFEFGLSNKELLLTAFSQSFVMLFVALAGVSSIAGTFGPLLGDGLGISFVVGALLVTFVICWAAVIAGSVVRNGGFKARRRGSRIEVERGLLQRDFSGIDIDRIQSINIKQSFVRRCMGYCEVSLGRIDTASADSAKTNEGRLDMSGLVIHPFVKLDRVDELLGGLLPEFADRPQPREVSPLPRVSARRAVLRLCVWRNPGLYIAVCLAALHLPLSFALADSSSDLFGAPSELVFVLHGMFIAVYLVCALLTAVAAVSAILWYKGSGVARNRRFIAVRNDGLTTEFIIVPRTKVQSAYLRANPFQRHARVARLVLVTAAGIRRTNVGIWDVSESEGYGALTWLAPSAARCSMKTN